MRSVTARDDGGAALADGADLAPVLLDAGVVQMLLAMLARLAPIQPSGNRPRSPDDARGPDIPQPGVVLTTASDAAQWPARAPYRGYRGDLVAGAQRPGHIEHLTKAPIALLQVSQRPGCGALYTVTSTVTQTAGIEPQASSKALALWQTAD